jgi:hypothetical protein
MSYPPRADELDEHEDVEASLMNGNGHKDVDSGEDESKIDEIRWVEPGACHQNANVY